MWLSVIAILVSLVLLMVLAYRGTPVIIAAPLAAALAILLSGAPLLPVYTEIFMPGLSNFILNYFPLFLTGAVFGGLMKVSGFAETIALSITRILGAKNAIIATVLTGAILTYGGVSLFVAVFVLLPVATELFKAADIPRRLMPAAIALGAFTFTMSAMPGSPQIQNIIPGTFFGTHSFAAPVIGFTSSALILTTGLAYLEFRRRQLQKAGERFTDSTYLERKTGNSSQGTEAFEPESGGGSGSLAIKTRTETSVKTQVLAWVPILLVFTVNLASTYWILPAMDWTLLSDESFGGISLSDRIANWSVIIAMVVSIIYILAVNIRKRRQMFEAAKEGAYNSLMPIFNTASEVGYGSVIAGLAGFTIIKEAIMGMSMNPLLNSAVATSVLAGITGSASGGMTIALNALGEGFQEQAATADVSLEAMHRIVAIASSGLDTMPHNGAVLTLLMICGLTHKESYKDIFVVTLVITSLTALLMIGANAVFA